LIFCIVLFRNCLLISYIYVLDDIKQLIMTFEIELTRKDYLNYQTYYFAKRMFKQMFFYFILGIVFIEFSINSQTKLDVATATVYAAIYAAIFWLATYYRYIRPKKAWKKHFIGKVLLQFTNDGIIMGNSNAIHQWSTVKSFEKSKTTYYIFLDGNLVIIIPQQFLRPETEVDFIALIKQKANIA